MRWKKNTKLPNSGQSLIEVVVALGVVLFVLVSVVAVVVINIFGQRVSEFRVNGSNLARGMIEAVRNLRDSARLANRTLAEESGNQYVETTHCYVFDSFQAGNTWHLAPGGSGFGADTDQKIYQGLYQYSTSAIASTTPFKTRLVIDPICDTSTECVNGICEPATYDYPTGTTCTGNEDSCTAVRGYRVKSQVRWVENGKTQNFELVEFLYNWR